jgi:3-phenylpropionate/trans-cinnamate dioxygenase ferredoxin subunit
MAPVRIASIADIAPGTLAAFEVDGTPVVVVNIDGAFYALNNICSHAHALLSEGELDTDECTLTCPLHGSVFDLETGFPRTLPAFEPVPRYDVTVQGDELFVDVGE